MHLLGGPAQSSTFAHNPVTELICSARTRPVPLQVGQTFADARAGRNQVASGNSTARLPINDDLRAASTTGSSSPVAVVQCTTLPSSSRQNQPSTVCSMGASEEMGGRVAVPRLSRIWSYRRRKMKFMKKSTDHVGAHGRRVRASPLLKQIKYEEFRITPVRPSPWAREYFGSMVPSKVLALSGFPNKFVGGACLYCCCPCRRYSSTNQRKSSPLKMRAKLSRCAYKSTMIPTK
jgi:hypothetical protein